MIVSDSSYTIHISPDYMKVRVSDFVKLLGGNAHFLELARNPDSPNADMKVTAHSLPIDDRDGTMFQSNGSLQHHLANFQMCLEQLDTFYEQMNTIDEFCFVVHPLVVSTKCRQRTFKIGKWMVWIVSYIQIIYFWIFNYTESNVFVKIIVDPFAPSSLEIVIAGPSYKIGKFRQLYDDRIRDWDPSLDIHKNLLRVFGLILQLKKTKFNNISIKIYVFGRYD